MTTTNKTINRHGDEIRVGQLWTDPSTRGAIRTLRIDSIETQAGYGGRVVCTVLYSYDVAADETTEPNRVVRIKVDSLHTTPAGFGYRRIESARQMHARTGSFGNFSDDEWPFRNVVVFCDTCGTEAEADMLANYREQAFAGLRAICNDNGWLCTDRGDWCPNCAPAVTR